MGEDVVLAMVIGLCCDDLAARLACSGLRLWFFVSSLY